MVGPLHMTNSTLTPIIDVHIDPSDIEQSLRDDVCEGLTATPKNIPPKWFYDHTGSELFDRITRLDEYYPTRAEREILVREAASIVEISGADTFVELGAGTSDKTRALLDAATRHGRLKRFIPFDVSEKFLRNTSIKLASEYPSLEIHGVVGDFDRHVELIPTGGRRLVAMLGGTIGNYAPGPRARFLRSLMSIMAPGDHLLLGTDLVKDPDRLVRAYDDAAGVTAAFNKNVLSVINRHLDADFDVDQFDHVARWDAESEWIEMLLCSRINQTVHVGSVGLDVGFARGELMRTEISSKFRREGIERELGDLGLEMVDWQTDAAGDFGVSLSRL